MAELTKEVAIRNTRTDSNAAQRIVGTIFGLAEVTLATRLIFRLLGANPGNSLVRGLYAITKGFVGLFAGIFSPVATPGAEETAAAFEPATLIAMLAVALAAWALLKLITPRAGTRVRAARLRSTANSRSYGRVSLC